MRLLIAVVSAALFGAVVALLALPGLDHPPSVMPSASRGWTAATSSAAGGGGSVEHPAALTWPVSAVWSTAGGTRSGPGGVPLGFPATTGGAAAAATAWLAVLEGAGVLVEGRRPAVLDAIGDTAFAAAAESRLAARAAALGLDPAGRPAGGVLLAVVWPARGAYRVTLGDAQRARVEVWHPCQIGVLHGSAPVATQWRRAVLEVRWDAAVDDWRLAADISIVDGPTPAVAQPSRLERWELLRGLGTDWQLYADTHG